MKYNGDVLADDAPQWMRSEYEVWFRDPHVIAQEMLANPDYAKGIDYAPVRVFDASGSQEYQDFMSGD